MAGKIRRWGLVILPSAPPLWGPSPWEASLRAPGNSSMGTPPWFPRMSCKEGRITEINWIKFGLKVTTRENTQRTTWYPVRSPPHLPVICFSSSGYLSSTPGLPESPEDGVWAPETSPSASDVSFLLFFLSWPFSGWLSAELKTPVLTLALISELTVTLGQDKSSKALTWV